MKALTYIIIAAWVLIAAASIASCDDSASIKRELSVQSLAAAVDLVSTEFALSHPGISEGNPVLGHRGVRYAVKGAVVLGVSAITYELDTKGKHRAARAVRWGAVAVQVAVGALNVRKGLRAR